MLTMWEQLSAREFIFWISSCVGQQYFQMLGTPYWVDFDLGEDVRNDARLAQDAAWSGAVADGRVHISHREATNKHSHRFRDSLVGFDINDHILDMALDPDKGKNHFQAFQGKEWICRHIMDFLHPGHGPLVMASINRRKLVSQQKKTVTENAQKPFRLLTRKRPVLSYEKLVTDTPTDMLPDDRESLENSNNDKEEGQTYVHLNYDAVTTSAAQKTSITFHEGKLARNGRRLSMTHHSFQVDRVFGAETTNDEITNYEMMPMLNHTLEGKKKGKATLICFGQTGTGKTYTLKACLEFLIHHIVHSHLYKQNKTTEKEEEHEQESTVVTVTFFEVFGKKCYDLLGERKTCRLLADSSDKMHLRGAKEHSFSARALAEHDNITSPGDAEAHILKLLADGMELRSSQETERNPLSSRSHAVCTLKFTKAKAASVKQDNDGGKGEDEVKGGELATDEEGSEEQESFIRLVDLAGSERNYETLKMSAKEHMESADINTALMSLKDCFRAAAAKASGEKLTIQAPAVDNHFSVYSKGSSKDPKKLSTKFPKPKIHNYQGIIPMVSKMDTEDEGQGKENEGESKARARSRPTGTAATKSTAKVKARVPYRAHLLTRVLKDCFEGDDGMMTTLIATVSPSPTDILHSLNTLDHVICMNRQLEALKSEVSVDIPIHDFFSPTSPVDTWTPQHVQDWLATADGGRFSMLQVPPDLDGKGLVSLEVSSLTALFAGTLRKARQGEEGAAWVVDNVSEQEQSSTIGRALWGSIRREQEAVRRRQAAVNKEFK